MQTNPQLKTTKTEKAVHGYGIENVREIVEKYHGTIEYRSEGDFLFVCKTVLIKGIIKNENNVTGIERKREHDTHNCAENSRYFLQTKCGR